MDKLKKYVSTDTFEQLLRANIDSLKSVIVLNTVELQKRTNIKYAEAKLILEKAAELLVGDKIKSATKLSKSQHLSTGCVCIDMICNGGIPSKGITEIFGGSGVGKTQLALQLSLMVQFSNEVGGFSKGALYICTEDVFPSVRLHSLAQTLPAKFNQKSINYEDNIFIEHIADYEQLRRLLYVRLPRLLNHVPIGLIVIDSIAGVFRSENSSVNYVTRSEEIYSIVMKLKEYSREHNLATICINQVMDDPNTGLTKPCLGQAWANLVTSRFKIRRLHPESKVRVFEVVNCPMFPQRNCMFLIKPQGLIPYNLDI